MLPKGKPGASLKMNFTGQQKQRMIDQFMKPENTFYA